MALRLCPRPLVVEPLHVLERAKQRVEDEKQPEISRQQLFQRPLALTQLPLPTVHARQQLQQLTHRQLSVEPLQDELPPEPDQEVPDVRPFWPWSPPDHPPLSIRLLEEPEHVARFVAVPSVPPRQA